MKNKQIDKEKSCGFGVVYGLRCLAITDAGVLGCALQNTYTFSAKGLLQSAFNRQKSLENFSLPLVTLLKGFELTHNITPPLLH